MYSQIWSLFKSLRYSSGGQEKSWKRVKSCVTILGKMRKRRYLHVVSAFNYSEDFCLKRWNNWWQVVIRLQLPMISPASITGTCA